MKDEDNSGEERVQKRYIELGGLIRDGHMVNKDKEERARQYVKITEKLIEKYAEQQVIHENSKYGELIIQTNDVQFHLSTIVIMKSGFPDDDFQDYIYNSAELGTLINLFNACSKDLLVTEHLVPKLRQYNKRRNQLAHKMKSNKRLTLMECGKTIKEGDEILGTLKLIIETIY